jgi:hypothetical protein
MLPDVTKRFVLFALFVVSSLVCLGFTWFGWGEAVHAKDIGKTAGVSSLVAWPAYFLVPLAFGSLTIQFFWNGIQALRHPENDHFVGDPDDAAVLEDIAKREEAAR